MSREGGGGRAWSLLTLYNLMFVLPLLAVFGLSALGVRSQRLSAWTRRHVVPAKLLLALVFLALAALLVMSMRG
jgi:cytochrome c biogenesis protein CcdA